MIKIFLKPDVIPNNWLIVSENGSILSGPKYFRAPNYAVDWASAFVSSWQSIDLVILSH